MIPASISGYLDRHHARYAVLAHPTAYTAQEEAAAARVPGNEWAKTVVCFADGQPVLAVLPAPFAVDLTRLKQTLHARSIRLAREQEFAPMYRDCEVGAMPPLGPLYGQRVIVDEHLTSDPEIVFNAGSHQEAIRMPFAEFARVAQPTPARIASALQMPASREEFASDPVCGARLEEDLTAEWSRLGEDTYYFCSRRCKMEFDDNPYAYARDRH
jgi:Ala-tRNA(Pro) deacylase